MHLRMIMEEFSMVRICQLRSKYVYLQTTSISGERPVLSAPYNFAGHIPLCFHSRTTFAMRHTWN